MFTHLQEENISYIDHWKVSMSYSLNFMSASIKAIVHAFIPDLFKTSSSDMIKNLHEKMKS